MRREKSEMEKAGFGEVGYAATSYEKQDEYGIYITIVGAGYWLECYLWSVHDMLDDRYEFVGCGHAETKAKAISQSTKCAGDYVSYREDPSHDEAYDVPQGES